MSDKTTTTRPGWTPATQYPDPAIVALDPRFEKYWLKLSCVDRLATGWTLFGVAIALIVATALFRRWRHLFAFVGSVLALEVIGGFLIDAFERPRPYAVTAVGRWQGFSLPSATDAIVSFTVVGIIYMLVVPGRPRHVAKRLGVLTVATLALSRLYPANLGPG